MRGADGRSESWANCELDFAEDRSGKGADAPVRPGLLLLTLPVRVAVDHRDTAPGLFNGAHLRAERDKAGKVLGESIGDSVHAADGLKHRRLKVLEQANSEATP